MAPCGGPFCWSARSTCWTGSFYVLDRLVPNEHNVVIAASGSGVLVGFAVSWWTVWWVDLHDDGVGVRHLARLRRYPRQELLSVSFGLIKSQVQVHPLPITLPLGSNLFAFFTFTHGAAARVKVGPVDQRRIGDWLEATKHAARPPAKRAEHHSAV